MKNTIIENKAKLAVKRALKGPITGQDMLAIVRFQMKEFREVNDYGITILMLYSSKFN